MSGQSINFKRGDTLRLECVRTDSAGLPVDLSTLAISSQVRAGSFVDDMVSVITSPLAGEFTLSATAAQTSLWPVGNIYCDIEFFGVETESSETFIIYTIEDITRAS